MQVTAMFFEISKTKASLYVYLLCSIYYGFLDHQNDKSQLYSYKKQVTNEMGYVTFTYR